MNNVIYIGVSPVIFKIGPISVGWYGLMVALAVIAVVGWVAWQNSKKHYFTNDTIFTCAIIGIISGIIVSKLLHVIDLWSYYVENPGKILSGEGLTIWGAVIGVTLGIWIYSLISRKFRFTLFADLIAPGILLSHALGRIGCTLNGCCYGIESHSSLAVIYTDPHSYGPQGIPVLPTQIYEIFYVLVMFVILLFLRGHFKKEGTIFYIYFFMYAAWRFGIDFIREGTPFLFGLHEAQFIGLIIMIIMIPLIFYKNGWVKKPESDTTTLPQEPV